MVDWLSFRVPTPRGWGIFLESGATVFVRAGGEIDRVVPAWLPVEGSYSAAMRVRVAGSCLSVSGNPVKFLTGQNADGSEDAYFLAARVVPLLCAAVGLPPLLSVQSAVVSRVDITRSVDLGSRERVADVLRHAAVAGRVRYQGRSSSAGNTVYFGQRSQRHSVKLYGKGDELRAHDVAVPADVRYSLLAQVDGLLRLEVCVRGKQLGEDGVSNLVLLTGPVLDAYYRRYVSGLEIAAGTQLLDDEVLALPRRLRGTYELWRRGVDVSAVVSRATLFRHRRELMAISGGRVDVLVLRPEVATQDVGRSDVIEWLTAAEPWRASGRLASWIAECRAA